MRPRIKLPVHQELRILPNNLQLLSLVEHHQIRHFMHCSASSFFLSSLHALGRRDGDDDERVADDAGEEDDEDERDQHHLVRVDAHPAVEERRTIHNVEFCGFRAKPSAKSVP